MVPFEAGSDLNAVSSGKESTGPKATTNGDTTNSRVDRSPTVGDQKPQSGSRGVPKPVEGSKEGSISNAEAKRRAKADKIARRAQEKQEKEPPIKAEQQGGGKTNSGKDTGRRGSVTPASTILPSKGQTKKTGSTTASTQKPLPHRSAQPQSIPIIEKPKKESKKVALFGHLYGHARRTTIAGASKDVHPAVLALGLQMSNYVICGSNARCLATLLVFKRVSVDMRS